jgi:hypothetical protein
MEEPHKVIIFLKFDGIFHPQNEVHEEEKFSRASFFWRLLRSCPEAEVVFSTSWKNIYTVDELIGFVTQGGGEDLYHRFIGATPSVVREPMANSTISGFREQECNFWLLGNDYQDRPWIALDDVALHFSEDCPELYLVNNKTGLTEIDVENLITLVNSPFIHDELLARKDMHQQKFFQDVENGKAKADDASMFHGLARHSTVKYHNDEY